MDLPYLVPYCAESPTWLTAGWPFFAMRIEQDSSAATRTTQAVLERMDHGVIGFLPTLSAFSFRSHLNQLTLIPKNWPNIYGSFRGPIGPLLCWIEIIKALKSSLFYTSSALTMGKRADIYTCASEGSSWTRLAENQGFASSLTVIVSINNK